MDKYRTLKHTKMKSVYGKPGKPVLPPIPSSSNRRFLLSIEDFIKTEEEKLSSAGQLDAEQRYIIYEQVFDKMIDYSKDYKHLLAAIKREYDEVIDALRQGHLECSRFQAKLKSMTSEPTTLMYYRKRASELEERIEIINKDSDRIQRKIEKLLSKKRVMSPIEKKEASTPMMVFNPAAPIPGMSIEDSLDMDALEKYHQQLIDKKKKLIANMHSKYVPIQRKQELDLKLSLALQEKEEAEVINKRMMDSYRKKRLIADTISSWAKSDKTVDLYETLEGIIQKQQDLKDTDESTPTNISDDLDPMKSKEAESLLDYVERFNELFVSGQYKAAAISAAHSPRGILRNMETMERFKAMVQNTEQDPPLLMFFEALIGSSNLARHPVNAALTLEGVTCALSHEKLELVVHWVTQQRITFSEPLGDVIWDYRETEPQHKDICLALAQLIYRKCSSLRKAALCMCLQGQIQGALDYAYHSKRFSLDDYLFLLKKCPTMDLINGLTKEWDGKPAALSVGLAVLSLLCTDHKEYGLLLLENINQCGETALEQVVVNDVVCTAEGWVEIAEECSGNDYRQLSEKIMSIVTSQDGVVKIPPKEEDAKIMEHVFL